MRRGLAVLAGLCLAMFVAEGTETRTFGTNGTTRVLLHPSNNTAGEKNVVFWYEGKDGVVVDGEGATFVFRGNVFPFAARKCRNLTFRNFTVTTEFPSCAGFRVETADEKGFTVRFDEGTCPYRVDGDALVFDLPGLPVSTRGGRISLHALDRIAIHYLMTPSSPGDKDEFPSTFVGVVPKDLGDRRVRFDYYGDRHAKSIPCPYRVGERVVFNLEEKRLRDVFFLEDCENVKIENVTVRRFGGMGVVAQRSGGITIDRFVAEPNPGEGVTLTADVFQFINCHGQVRIENSSCGNSLDDVLNVHGNYLVVERVDGRRVSLRVKHVQQCGFFPYRPGDALEFVVERSREVIATAKVVSVAPHPTDRYAVTLTLASEVSVPAGTLVENVTLNPDVTLRNNRFHDFPHARLSGRGRFLIERNRFERCQTAIYACDLAEYWYESGRIGEMTIRDNDFVDANALGGGAAIAFGVSGWGDDAPKVHGRVVLADNRYERSGGCASFPGVREAVLNPRAPGVRISSAHPRYFETADGRPWIPIGCNICFDRLYDGTNHAHEAVRENFDRWLRAFAANGGNCIRLWAGHRSLEVMPEKPGVWDAERTKTLKGIIGLCEQLGIRVKVTLESFRICLGEETVRRTANPVGVNFNYNGTFNRTLYAPYADDVPSFFKSEECRRIYLGKARYLKNLGLGDSPAVYCWELWNEINSTSPMSEYAPWSAWALGELKKMFPGRLTVNNLGSFSSVADYQPYDELATEAGNDFLQVHRYLDAGADLDVCRGPMDVVAASAVREMLDRRADCPAILSEVGAVQANHAGPFSHYRSDKEGTLLHDALFAAFFAGSAGCGQFWHWDHQYIDGNGLWWQFRRFANAIEGLDPVAEGFRPFYTESRRLRMYGLRGRKTAVVWCRDKRSSWEEELVRGNPPETLSGEWVPFRNCRLECYLPWEDRRVTVDAPRLPPFRRSIVVRVPANAVEGVVRPH